MCRVLLTAGLIAGGGWWLADAAAARLAVPAELPAGDRDRLEGLASAADVSTRVTARPFVARPDVFEYLLDHPEFASHVTQTLRLARYRIWRTPEGLNLDDGWGATGRFWVVHASEGTRVIEARGQYKKTLLPTIHGQALTTIEYELTPLADERSVVRTTVTGYLKIEGRLAKLALKIASGIAQRKADLEARRLMKVFAEVSQAVERDPRGVYEQLRRRPDVPPHDLEGFRQLLSDR